MSSLSTTKPQKLQCDNHEKCMQMIQAILDGSATADEVNHFKNHMSDCLPCIEGYEHHKNMKEALQAKVEKKCCPEATIKNIKTKLGIASLLFGGLLILHSIIE